MRFTSSNLYKYIKIAKTAQFGIDRETKTDEFGEEHTTEVVNLNQIGALVNSYNRGLLTLDELLEGRSVNAIAQRYARYRSELGAELLHLNPGKLDLDTQKRTTTTFVHALFENKVPKDYIIDYFKKVVRAIGDHKQLSQDYMGLSDADGVSILKLIERQDLEAQYLGIDREIRSLRGAYYLFPQQAGFAPAVGNVDTHTQSIHKSVDESFVRLASNYAANYAARHKEETQVVKDSDARHKEETQVVKKESDRKVIITRDDAWNESINKNLKELEKKITDLIGKKESLKKAIKPTLVKGEDLESAKDKFKLQTALRLLQGLKQESFGAPFQIRPGEATSCGLTLKEMVSIGYESLSHREKWRNQDQEAQQFMSFIETGLYRAMRGYNIDENGEDEWLKYGKVPDNNKCLGGTVNQIAQGLLDHLDVKVVVLNASTMRPVLLTQYLPKVLKKLNSPELMKLQESWLTSNILSEELSRAVVQELNKTELSKEFDAYDMDRFALQIMRTLSDIEAKSLREKVIGKEKLGVMTSLDGFEFDENDGWVASAESLYNKDPDKYSKLLENELKAGFVESDEFSEHAIQSRVLMNFILASPNKGFVEQTQTILKKHFETLTPENREYKCILAMEFDQVALALTMMNLNLVSPNPIDRIHGLEVPAFEIAIKHEQVKIVKKILEKCPETIEYKNPYGQTPLSIAVYCGNEVIVKLLLEKMSSEAIHAKNEDDRTMLEVAVGRGNAEIVELLLEKMFSEAITARDSNNKTLLEVAMDRGNAKIVEMLLEKMPSEAINSQNADGCTALHRAVEGGNEVIAELLLEKMSSEAINSQNADGCTALRIAMDRKEEKIIKAILKHSEAIDLSQKSDVVPDYLKLIKKSQGHSEDKFGEH